MLFNSIDFLFFIVIVLGIFYLLPQKLKMCWILVMSYVFYATWNIKYVLLLLSTTVVTYLAGIGVSKRQEVDRSQTGLRKIIVAITVIIGVFAIGFYKYADFAVGNFNRLLNIAGSSKHFEVMEIIMPVGISFYVLQSLGYVIDVYRGKIEAEKNILIYGLFVSFFPQISSGPIGRAGDLIPQFRQKVVFDTDRIKDGLITFAYGLFLKMVVADNISIYVTRAHENFNTVSGMELLMAVILFSIQIYCDFYGYSLMALGCGRMMQIELMQNFKQPYLQDSIRGFWRGWHISLTSWFTDYLYIPLGGNRKGKVRKCINTMIVFLVSGLWHGAAWHYIFWGGINGVLMVLEEFVRQPIESFVRKLKIATDSKAWKLTKIAFVFAMMSFAWLFFRADSFGEAIYILKSIAHDFRAGWFLTQNCFDSFGASLNVVIILVSIIVMTVVDYLQNTGRDVKRMIFGQQTVYRWLIYLLLLYVIVCWGAYGEEFEQTRFIYFEF